VRDKKRVREEDKRERRVERRQRVTLNFGEVRERERV